MFKYLNLNLKMLLIYLKTVTTIQQKDSIAERVRFYFYNHSLIYLVSSNNGYFCKWWQNGSQTEFANS